MNKLILLFGVLLSNVVLANDAYLGQAEKQFESLLEMLTDDEKSNWKHRSFEEVMELSKKLKELDKRQEYIRSRRNSKDIEGILAFSYLADAMEYKLRSRTKLTNDLGSHIYTSLIAEKVEPVKKAIELELVGLQNANGTIQLQSKLTEYFSIQRRLDKRASAPPVLRAYEYRPKSSAWDNTPSLVDKFILYDWVSAIDLLDEDLAALEAVKDSFVSFNYLRISDPIAFVSLGSQLAVLLIAVAGYLISYTREPSILVVASLVSLSMFASVALIFISSSTALNLAVQALVPGAFISYWAYKKSHNNAAGR
jgi:hypothetical protein